MSLRTGKSALSCFVIKLGKPSLLMNFRISLMPVFKGPLSSPNNSPIIYFMDYVMLVRRTQMSAKIHFWLSINSTMWSPSQHCAKISSWWWWESFLAISNSTPGNIMAPNNSFPLEWVQSKLGYYLQVWKPRICCYLAPL